MLERLSKDVDETPNDGESFKGVLVMALRAIAVLKLGYSVPVVHVWPVAVNGVKLVRVPRAMAWVVFVGGVIGNVGLLFGSILLRDGTTRVSCYA